MAEKKITRKIIAKKQTDSKAPIKEVQESVEETEPVETKQVLRSKKACFFCQSKTSPSYTDISVLRHFVTDRAKITPRAKSNLCGKHQRAVTKQIKYARHLALLPFTPQV